MSDRPPYTAEELSEIGRDENLLLSRSRWLATIDACRAERAELVEALRDNQELLARATLKALEHLANRIQWLEREVERLKRPPESRSLEDAVVSAALDWYSKESQPWASKLAMACGDLKDVLDDRAKRGRA